MVVAVIAVAVIAEVSSDVSAVATSDALVALIGLLLLSGVLGSAVARRSRRTERGWVAWFGGFASVSLILAVTLCRDGLPSGRTVGTLDGWFTETMTSIPESSLGSSQFLLNIVLFVPAGAVWTWLIGRPLLVLGGLAAFSMVVEAVQAVAHVGSPDVADLLANTVGAGLGVAAAVILRRVVGNRGRTLSPRSQMIVAGVVVTVAVLSMAGWFVSAARAQEQLARELRDAFEGTHRSSIETWLADDPGSVFGAAPGHYSTGIRRSDDRLEIRYPTDFFGLSRCVFVVWSADGVDTRPESGRDCTDFIDGDV
ncbi:MAG: VanZ family protein [Actinomycetota bacterium]|nr:VanZ family protein [Actinomycetota bacterium]